MDVIRQACLEQQKQRGEKSSNVFWGPRGKRYFWEITRRDQWDGGICGTIHLDLGAVCRKAGTFRIDGGGKLSRGPAFFRNAVAAAMVGKCARYPCGRLATAQIEQSYPDGSKQLLKLCPDCAKRWVDERPNTARLLS